MINYDFLHKSAAFYETQGFKRVETPWLVSEATSKITKPQFAKDFVVNKGNKKKVLVASGEQSFLYQYSKGFLPRGKFQTITPCFRDDEFDELHKKYFMKLELIDTDDVNDLSLDRMIDQALANFNVISKQDYETVLNHDSGYDIVLNDIELGSYGIRGCHFLEWVYGTGIAEPRFSDVLRFIGAWHKMSEGFDLTPEEIEMEKREFQTAFKDVKRDFGYHTRAIARGVFGEASKIREEFEEFEDALAQNNPLMALIELSDLIGAIEGYAANFNMTLAEILEMKNATKRAFMSGARK